jgi:predicted nuclease with TOPRIM domain
MSLGNNDPSWVIAHLKTSRHPERMADLIGAVEEISARLGEVSREDERNRQRAAEIVAHQKRIRDNLSRLSGNHDEGRLRSRYVDELEKQEDELARLASQHQELQERRAAIGEEMRQMVAGWTFERLFEPAG